VDTNDHTPSADADSSSGLFREEAIRHHFDEAEQGDLLRVSSGWANWIYWFLVGVVGIGFLYLVLGTAPIYVSGPAILRIGGATPLTSPVVGTIQSVEVLPGQQVAAGQVLVRFRAEREKAQLAMYQKEFELQLLARLRSRR